MALGDVVETDEDHIVRRVVAPSGRYVFRVWFGDEFVPRGEIAEDLKAMGSVVEWSSSHLLGVDTEDHEHAERVAEFLAEHEQLGHFTYETGRS